MPLTLMYVTNDPAVAGVAERSGVDWIFVDLEINGKQARQGHLDTVISGHTIADVKRVRDVVRSSQLLVRVNPICEASADEVNAVIQAGADIVMLPYFKQRDEVVDFVEMVDGRAKICLLVETPEAAESIDEILTVRGIDFAHIGINDLHLGYKRHFMFELLADGTVESLCRSLKEARIPYGFGGIARLGLGDLPAEAVVAEHYRLGSSMAILSRSFCNVKTESSLAHVADVFATEVARLRAYEDSLADADGAFFEMNRRNVIEAVQQISHRKALTDQQRGLSPSADQEISAVGLEAVRA